MSQICSFFALQKLESKPEPSLGDLMPSANKPCFGEPTCECTPHPRSFHHNKGNDACVIGRHALVVSFPLNDALARSRRCTRT